SLVVTDAVCFSFLSQCGGANWSGSTCCVEGYACEVLAETYSQVRRLV
ncbi:unnamed protein product, partial [Laminaria digitata]